ncbi:unnamed protein product [Ectocarpus sp. CCAP 1310/34]|nr:unnamed protein product [Ectocarpus sp. CCAP 1310/34]
MLGSGKHYKDVKALRLDVAAMISAAGRSFHSGKGGGRQNKYICNGAAGGCQATVRACRQRLGEFKVTFFIPEHNDLSGGKVGAKAAALEGFASAAMVSNPTMKGADLKRSLEQSTGLRVSYSAASRLKVAATRASKEQLEHGYRIMDSFRRVILMLGRAARAAVRSPMKVVGKDGGHLKGEWNGMVLTLTCKDANNEMIHVATVIGPKEDTSLYKTLLRNCKKNPKMRDLLEDSKTIFFTDQHKGATCALRGEAPLAQHRYCLRHIILNIEKIGSVQAPLLVMHSPMRCDSLGTFYRASLAPMSRSLTIGRGMSGLTLVGPDTALQDVVTNNLSEPTNSAVGVEARKLPPLELMRSVLADTAKKFAHSSTLGNGTWTPYSAATFEDQRKKSAG